MPVPVEPAHRPHTTASEFRGGFSRSLLVTLMALALLPGLVITGFAVYQLQVLAPQQSQFQLQQALAAGAGQISPQVQQQLIDGISRADSNMVAQLIFLAVFSIACALLAAYLVAMRFATPLSSLAQTVRGFAAGDWLARVNISRSDELGLLATSFNQMADEITTRYRHMQADIEERTRQIRTASEVAQLATSATSLDELLSRSVGLLVERFGYYHASVLLLDEPGENLVLKEGTGPAGAELKARGYRVGISSQSMVGWAAANNKARVAGDVREDRFYLKDELLPGTRSEAAIPIALGTRVLGVLDVQSQEKNTFDPDTVEVLQTLASQIAAALLNVSALQSTQLTLQETSYLYRASGLVSDASTREEVFDAVLSALKGAPHATLILTLENDRFHVLSNQAESADHGVILPEWIPMPTLGIDTYLAKDAPTLIPEVALAPTGLFNLLSIPRKLSLSACALFPIFKEGKLDSLLMLLTSDKNSLTDNLVQPYYKLSIQMATALQKIEAAQSLQARLAQLETLTNIGHAVSLETDLTQIYERIYQLIREHMGDVYLLIAQYDAKRNLIEVPFIYEGGERINIEPFPLGQGLTSLVIRSGKPLLLVKDAEQQAVALGAKIIGKSAKSWMGVPLQVGGQTIGVVVLQDTEAEGRFNQADLDFMLALAPQIAVSIRNAQLLTEMKNTLTAFEQERYLLNTLLENVPDRIYFKNREGRFIRASHSVSSALNLPDPNQLIGKSDFDYYPEEIATKRYMDEQALIRSGQPEIGRIERETQSGSPDRWWLTTRLPLTDRQGQPAGLFGISRDITDLKAAQEMSQRRAQQLRTAAEIARDASGTLELDDLLRKVVNLVRDRFNFYHASIFLMDSSGENAILRESTGEAGRQMKAAGHNLSVGSQSIVGQVTLRKEPLVVNDVTKDPTHLPNPLLPETHAEMAIPMVIADRVLGALDVQSTQRNAFSPEDISILQILTDQLAIAVVNAQLFAETQETLAQHRLLHHITTAAASSGSVDDAIFSTVQGLRVTLGGDRVAILLINEASQELVVKASAGFDQQEVKDLSIPVGQGITGWVAANRQALRVEDTQADERYLAASSATRSELAVPLIYREQLLGVLNLESEKAHAYDESDQEMFGTLGSSLAAIIANASLIEQVRKQIDRQRLLFEVTSKIRRSVSIDTILRTSATEINRVLGARQTEIRLTAGDKPAPGSVSNNGRANGKEPHS